ncbi:hypothetical protein DSO57_1027849 [Entomophthora muscae]|uniref:Uncharacterized protein n=1 Tax=Entomophthora muscae TaxID=34485 RepID=A0ACC2TP52_9FUNG|nr:hypothetical protein DSO57_1027849 [Entomophthora muscae]
MVAYLCWEKIPSLRFCGLIVMWSTLMLALESPYAISIRKLKIENNLVQYAQLCLQDFSYNGVFLTDNQVSCALKLLELVFTTWSNPCFVVGSVPLQHGSDSHKYQLQRAMRTTLELFSYSREGSCKSMTLVRNLVLSGSKAVYHQRLHHMSEYIEWLLGIMYSVGDKAPEEYAQRESLP